MAAKNLSQPPDDPAYGLDDDRLSELVAAAQAGDQGAFEALYHANVNRVYGLCLRLTGDQNNAEVLTQDTFVRAWFALGGFGGTGRFDGWLSRIATNLWRDRFRTHRRRDQLLQKLAEEGLTNSGGVPAQTGPGHEGAEAGDAWLPARDPGWGLLTALDLERALEALPQGARTVFVLHDIEGYKHGEIAELLGVTTGTAKAQLHRARRLLRVLLAGDKEAAHGA